MVNLALRDRRETVVHRVKKVYRGQLAQWAKREMLGSLEMPVNLDLKGKRCKIKHILF